MPTKLEDRDYKKEYAAFHGKPAQIKNRAKRNAAVAERGRQGKSSQDGKEVDHIRGIEKGNGKNTRVISRAANRRKA